MVSKVIPTPDTSDGAADNAAVIDAELAWLEAVMAARFAAYGGDSEGATPPDPPSLD